MPKDGKQRGNSSRKNYYKRHKEHRQQKHSESSSASVTFGSNGSRQKRVQRREEARKPAPETAFKHLDIENFLSLPLPILANVCKFLYLQDLTTLSRTSTRLREFFMSKLSKPCWDQGRWLQNVPEWKGVADPRAAALIFDTSCQGSLCNNLAPLKSFYVCKRYCKTCGPKYLLSAKEVSELSYGISMDFISLLPWTKKRASSSEGNVDVGRFVLVDDVEYLERRFTEFDREDDEAVSRLGDELQRKLKESQKIAQRMEGWTQAYEADIWHAKNDRFVRFVTGLRSRWGWNVKQMPQVTSKRGFDELVNWIEEVPELTQAVWNRAEVIMRDLITEVEMAKPPSLRPWSLKKSDKSTSDSR